MSAPLPDSPVASAVSDDPAASVIATVTAINSALSDPMVSEEVTQAMQRLMLVQLHSIALEDAVNNLRALRTVELAAIGAAARQLVATGDIEKWQKAVPALQAGSQAAGERLQSLVELAMRSLSPLPGQRDSAS